MVKRLQDRVVIVTGAGGPRGIGRSVALACARDGAHVVVAGGRAATRVADEIRALGRQSLPLPTDVSNPDDVRGLSVPPGDLV